MTKRYFYPLNKVKSTIVFVIVSCLVAVGFTFFWPADPSSATSTASINVGATSVRVNQANNLGITLSGFSTAEQNASYQVTLKYVDANGVDQTNGVLTATQGGTSLITGYNSYSSSKLGFRGTYQAVQNALASVTWTPSSASSGLTLRIGLATAPGANQYYDANSGHYYEYVSTTRSWESARDEAATRTLNGLNGYLAHITSRAENDFVANETSAPNIWIGANDIASEGQWRWGGRTITGESDFVFGTYSSNASTNSATPTATASGWGLNSWYTNRIAGWASGEPNNWGGTEDCAVTNWSGARGQWNDLACSNQNAYLVEYGGAGGTLTTLAITVNANMGASNAMGTFTSPSSPTSSTAQTFGLSFNADVSGISGSDFRNNGTATGCTFTPSASSALSGVSINVVASGCSTGTLQPQLIENSVVVSGSPVIPAALATSVTIVAGPATIAQSTLVLSDNVALSTGSPLTLTITPRDSGGRNLGAGKTVAITSTLGTVSQVTDNGDGTYSATITPGGQAGNSVVAVTAEGTLISDTLSFRVVTPPVWTSPSSPTSTTTQNFTLTFSDNVSGIQSADFVNVGTATGCSFTPSSNTAVSGTPITVTASDCSIGTVQPRLLSSSVIPSTGLSFAAVTASAISIEVGSATIAQSTISLSRTTISTAATTPISISITPRDLGGRDVGAGKTVTISSTLGLASSLTDNGDGTYSATFAPGSIGGVSAITVRVNGVVISSGLEILITTSVVVVPPRLQVAPPSIPQQISGSPFVPVQNGSSSSTKTSVSQSNVNVTNVELPITSQTGQLPRGESGKALMLVNGQINEINIEPLGINSFRASTPDGLFFEVMADDVIATENARAVDGSLVIKPGQKFQISGTGFAPNSEVFIWLFSTPKLLTNVDVTSQGTINAEVALKLGLPPGKHTLQVSGVHPDGTTRAIMLDVVIPEETNATVSENPSTFPFWILIIISLVVLFMLIVLLRKKRSS